MPAPYLILAVGNESRGDDALGPALLQRLQSWLEHEPLASQVETIEEFQLQVENALDLQARKLVLFLDAGIRSPAPFGFREETGAPMDGHATHAVSPGSLLEIYRMLERREPPPLFTLCISGYAFDLGTEISQPARAHLDAAFDFACRLFDAPTLKHWRRLAGTSGPSAEFHIR
jgi:hydrogenase maturation protease